MLIGYARASTIDRNPELQLETLRCAGCEKVFTEHGSGARDDRPELNYILSDVLRAGDTLVVWKFDHQFERALIRARRTAGLAEARQRGRKGGHPPAMRPRDIAARVMMKEGKALWFATLNSVWAFLWHPLSPYRRRATTHTASNRDTSDPCVQAGFRLGAKPVTAEIVE